jgi:cytochrome c oxidase subunit IV
MNNSILTTLASINATVLGIVFAVLVAFFIYSYQELSKVWNQLSDLRVQIAKTMHLPTYYKIGAIDYAQYSTPDGSLNFEKIQRELHQLSPTSLPEAIKQRLLNNGINVPPSDEEVKERAARLIDLINLLSISYPYCERSQIDEKSIALSIEPKRLEYTQKWQNDFLKLNSYLSWFWQGRKNELRKLVLEYESLYKKEQLQRFNAEKQKILSEMKETGRPMSEAEVEDMLSNYHNDLEFERIVTEFFHRVVLIESTMVPQVKDLSFKLNLYESKFHVKGYLVISLIFSFVMLVAGIFLPMYIHLYWQPPYIKAVEFTLLLTSSITYASAILIFLKKAMEIKFQ